jgi:hypothetical protein
MAATQRPDGETRPIAVLAGIEELVTPTCQGMRGRVRRGGSAVPAGRTWAALIGWRGHCRGWLAAALPRHRARRRNSDVSAAGCELRDSGDRGGGLFGA